MLRNFRKSLAGQNVKETYFKGYLYIGVRLTFCKCKRRAGIFKLIKNGENHYFVLFQFFS